MSWPPEGRHNTAPPRRTPQSHSSVSPPQKRPVSPGGSFRFPTTYESVRWLVARMRQGRSWPSLPPDVGDPHVHVVVVVRDRLHDPGRPAEADVQPDERELRARSHEAADEVLRQRTIDVGDAPRRL